MAAKHGFEALMEVVAAQWCLGARLTGDGELVAVTDFIPATGAVDVERFIEWVFLASQIDPRDPPAIWQRARVAIRKAFIEHMGGEVVDAGALRWTIVEGQPSPTMPLPDPEAFTRNLTEAELEDYRNIYGADSREWILAENELARRRRPPLWTNLILLAVGLAGLAGLGRWLGWF